MGSYHITVLKGDGIGPDVVTEAMGVLECVGKKYGHDFVFNEKLAAVRMMRMASPCLRKPWKHAKTATRFS